MVGSDNFLDNEINNSISSAQHLAFRTAAVKFEQQNTNAIHIIPCRGNSGWYEFGDHSALFYYYEVCLPLGRKIKFEADTKSYSSPYNIGIIHTRDLDRIRNDIKRVGLLAKETTNGPCHTFILKHTYSNNEIVALTEREHRRRIDNVTPVTTHNLDPELYLHITIVGKRLHDLCNSRFDKISSLSNGLEIVKYIDNIGRYYHYLTRFSPSHTKQILSYLTAMHRAIGFLGIELQLASNFGLWDLPTSSSLASELTAMDERILFDIKQVKSRARNKNAPKPQAPPCNTK